MIKTKIILKKIKSFIEKNSSIRGGQYVFKGTRIPVFYVVEHFENGWTVADVVELFPEINKEAITEISNIIFEGNYNAEPEKIKITWLSYA